MSKKIAIFANLFIIDMKYRILIIVTLLAGLSCQAQNQIDKQGRRQGHWIKTDKDGSKIFEGNFVDGKETGVFKYYYPDGTLRMQNNFSEPGHRCSHEAYDEKGHLLAKGFFCEKNRDGEWSFYTESGKVIKQVTYRMGAKEGKQTIYTSKGDTAEVSHWKDNKRHGRWWKRIGEKGYITGIYVMGGLEGELKEYGQDGSLVRLGHYKDGSKHGSYQYFENKVLTIDEEWDKGILSDRKVLIKQPENAYISIFRIAYMMPKGKDKVIVVDKKGNAIIDHEPAEELYSRLRSDMFAFANKKSRVMVNQNCIVGITKDSEERDILELDPKPEFDIFPDEDCMKMVKSYQREGLDE